MLIRESRPSSALITVSDNTHNKALCSEHAFKLKPSLRTFFPSQSQLPQAGILFCGGGGTGLCQDTRVAT